MSPTNKNVEIGMNQTSWESARSTRRDCRPEGFTINTDTGAMSYNVGGYRRRLVIDPQHPGSPGPAARAPFSASTIDTPETPQSADVAEGLRLHRGIRFSRST